MKENQITPVDPNADPAAAEAAALEKTLVSARFGIGEWYGHSFYDLTTDQRKELAHYEPAKKSRMQKSERNRLKELEEKKAGPILTADQFAKLEELRARRALRGSLNKADTTKLEKLEAKLASGNPLDEREQDRLDVLYRMADAEIAGNKPCPFKTTATHRAICTKDGGVCSLRLYRDIGGEIVPVADDDPDGQGGIRATCPSRFHEQHVVFKWAGKELLKQENPRLATEVGFLESEETVDSEEGEDVGRIDMILVDGSKPPDYPMPWAALEIQAVYFSGKGMGTDFAAIKANIDAGGTGLIWPTEARRPDYRSSGPKRLMPQLQTKVPTLRRWGKKMAVVVDRSFFRSIGTMKTVEHASNSDIAWFIVDFKLVEGQHRMTILPGEVFYTTLEESVLGLTGGKPVSQEKFEERIVAALVD